jgi:signal transduction histidine kinase
MVREAISNAVRHGGASSVEVSIYRAAEHLIMKINDDGDGFGVSVIDDDQKGPAASGVGPVSLRERVSELGGLLDVSSSPGRTELRIRLPVA